ncbi:MAG: non-heme iron oxygenase ferredoxin subunit [Chloroflexota bacterium]|nr:non-heme iron oxygenase ferredoxin subunit [Chloroflexota bacterium]
MTGIFTTVARIDDLQPGEMMYVEAGNTPVCLINLNGEYHAINDTCTHQEASLSDGTIDGDEIECPLHGGVFCIRTGEPIAFPVVTPVEVYQVRVVGDEVQIAVGT